MRTGLIVLATVLGAVALWLVLFGAGRQQVQAGVLLGLWAALIAAFLVVGHRGQDGELAAELDDARARATELHEAQLSVVAQQQEQLEAARQAYFSQEIELRRFSELQLARDAGARRESDQDLQLALRHEVERVLAEQLTSLRAEVAALRAEVVDKLGGQLRLERIETTRVIGSDLEALQHEIRRLAMARQDSLVASARPVTAQPEPERSGRVLEAEPARTAAAGSSSEHRPSRVPDAELVEFPPPAPELPRAAATRGEPADPFASLPRLSPVQADLGLLSDQPEDGGEQRQGRRRAPEPDDSRYQGRRRAGGAQTGFST